MKRIVLIAAAGFLGMSAIGYSQRAPGGGRAPGRAMNMGSPGLNAPASRPPTMLPGRRIGPSSTGPGRRLGPPTVRGPRKVGPAAKSRGRRVGPPAAPLGKQAALASPGRRVGPPAKVR